MIAAAAADGRIDAKEQQKILGGLKQAGLDEAAQQFLTERDQQSRHRRGPGRRVASPEEAVQVYTAARIAIESTPPRSTRSWVALAEALESTTRSPPTWTLRPAARPR